MSTSTRAKALDAAGSLAFFQGRHDTAKTVLEQGLALYRELADHDGIASTLANLGVAALLGQFSDVDVAGLIEETIQLRPQLHDPRVVANLLYFLGMGTGIGGDWTRSAALYEEGLALFREVRDPVGILWCLQPLGVIALINGADEAAAATLRECLRLASEVDFKVIIQYSHYVLGCVAASQGHAARAARLWGATDAMNQEYGTTLSPLVCAVTNYEGHLAAARAQLGDEAFASARAEGRSMPPEQAVGYALEVPSTPDLPTHPAPVHPAGLSAREADVLRLVADGKSNAGVAEELFISARTVNWHLSSIYRKLGCRSRSEATRFAVDHGIVRQP